MMTHQCSSSFLCSHSSPLSLPSLFLSTSSTPTSSITLPDQNTTAPNPRNEARGSLAIIQPLTGYEHNVTDKFDVFEVTASIFQNTSVFFTYDLGDNGTESADAEIDDEHTRNALASPLNIQEREANADLSQACHSNEESLLPDARSILASTGELVAWLSQKRKCSQELDDGQIRNLLERQKERVLAENNIRELSRQIESQAKEIGHNLTGL